MKLSSIVVGVAVLCSHGQSGSAFVPLGVPARTSTTTTTGTSAFMTQQLNEIDEMCIENVAELCLQADAALAASAECDMDEHEALVNQLEDQKALLEAHVNRIDNLVHRLKADGMAKEEPETTYFAG